MEGPSVGTLLGVVAHVVWPSVECFEPVDKTTAVSSFDMGECHPLIESPVPDIHFPEQTSNHHTKKSTPLPPPRGVMTPFVPL